MINVDEMPYCRLFFTDLKQSSHLEIPYNLNMPHGRDFNTQAWITKGPLFSGTVKKLKVFQHRTVRIKKLD